MIRLKPGVRIDRLQPQMLIALFNAAELWSLYAHLPDLTITSGNDGTHMAGSFHYRGLAVDLRTRGLQDPKKVTSILAGVLGECYDVILEDQGGENEHLHVEFDPPATATPKRTV